MNRINVLILDDIFVVGDNVKTRIFADDESYRHDLGLKIHPYYCNEINDKNLKEASCIVNEEIRKNDIEYLLLDRGFGKIIELGHDNYPELEAGFLYKDNTANGFKIEHLLEELDRINENSLHHIKGIIVYTHDDYREQNPDKYGTIVKEEIIDKLKRIPSLKKTRIDVLLAYSEIYKIAEIDLYEGYAGKGVIKLGKKNEFILYGIFIGKLLYHKLIQMINIRRVNLIKEKKLLLFYRLIILYIIFISISVGGNAIFSYLFKQGGFIVGIISLLFGILIPFAVLLLKPSILIDINDE